MASHLTTIHGAIITQGEFVNLLLKLHHIPKISLYLTAKLTAKPVENSEQW